MRASSIVCLLAALAGAAGACKREADAKPASAAPGKAKGAAAGSGAPVSAGRAVASAGCPLFTPDDPWNQDVSGRAVNATWTSQIHALLGNVNIHPDFGAGFGIPINVVPPTQPKVPITFNQYPEESDPGPYPFPGPGTVKVEGTRDPTKCEDDCHVIAVQQGTCQLYEAWACHYGAGGWICGNGAKWDLTRKSTGQRPEEWTSADAAGLPIYAGLARYDEVMAGEITHAIRFTLPCSSDARVPPATHQAKHCPGPNTVPMGVRVRLKASYDTSRFGPVAQKFLRAFKKYGLILADNGGRRSTFYFQSEDHPSWPAEVQDLKRVPVSAFEAVQP